VLLAGDPNLDENLVGRAKVAQRFLSATSGIGVSIWMGKRDLGEGSELAGPP
jgi:hypothetical protein